MNTAGHRATVFYGYYIIAACFIILFLLWGTVLNTFSVFLKPISQDMNWGRGELSVALLVGAVASGLSSPLAGYLIQRLGAKKVMIAGTFAVGTCVIIQSRVGALWQFYVLFGIIGMGLMCSTIIPCSLLISNWFVSRRGKAMSAAFIGSSAGGMVMLPVNNWMILHYGWRNALFFIGIVILAIAIPLISGVVRTRPEDMGLKPYTLPDSSNHRRDADWGVDVKGAFRLTVFWQLALIMFILALISNGLNNHCVAYLTDLGHSSTQASYIWSLTMAGTVLGKLMFGPLADRWSARSALVIVCGLCAVSIGMLIAGEPLWLLIVSAVTCGSAFGAPIVLNPLLTGDYLGLKNFAALYGILNIMMAVGGAIGPVSAGYVFDTYGSYHPIFYLFIPLALFCGVIALFMRPVKQRS